MNAPHELPISVFGAILARRSVRAYLEQAVPRNTVKTLLEAAVRAPTAMHAEPWRFVVVQDKDMLQYLSDQAKHLFAEEAYLGHLERFGLSPDDYRDPDFNVFYDAGTLIVICAKLTNTFAIADCWLAAENLMLAASSLALGSCVIGNAVMALNLPEVKVELGLPSDVSAVAPIIVGWPANLPPATTRKLPNILAWFE